MYNISTMYYILLYVNNRGPGAFISEEVYQSWENSSATELHRWHNMTWTWHKVVKVCTTDLPGKPMDYVSRFSHLVFVAMIFLWCSKVLLQKCHFLKTRFSCITIPLTLYGREQLNKMLLQTDQQTRVYQSVYVCAYIPSNRLMTDFQMSVF